MARERADGFPGQRMCVVPAPVLEETWSHPLLESLYVTDIGEFPSAIGHRRSRPAGADQHIVIICVAGTGWISGGTPAGNPGHETDHRPIRAGQAVLIRKGEPHAYGSAESDPWHILWAHVIGPAADAMIGLLDNPMVVVDVAPPLLDSIRATLNRAIEQMLRGYQLETLICAASSLRDCLVRLIYENPLWHPHVSASVNLRIEHLIDLMRRRIRDPLTLAELADHAELSQSHLTAVFRARTGYPPMTYFARLRVQTACRRLYATTHSVASIAASVGFDDPYYFSRTFKRIMGISPRAYRRSFTPELREPDDSR